MMFLNNDLIPLAKRYGFNFSIDDLIEYESKKEENMRLLSEDELDEISGGVSLRVFAAGLFASLTVSAPVLMATQNIMKENESNIVVSENKIVEESKGFSDVMKGIDEKLSKGTEEDVKLPNKPDKPGGGAGGSDASNVFDGLKENNKDTSIKDIFHTIDNMQQSEKIEDSDPAGGGSENVIEVAKEEKSVEDKMKKDVVDEKEDIVDEKNVEVKEEEGSTKGNVDKEEGTDNGFDLKTFVEQGRINESIDKYGNVALHYVCVLNSVDQVNFLIEKNADINKANSLGQTPLMFACIEGNKDVVELLLASNVDISLKNNNGKTALNLAEENGNEEIADLLRAKTDVDLDDNLDFEVAEEEDVADEENVEVKEEEDNLDNGFNIKAFVEQGRINDGIDEEGNTLLIIACSQDDIDVEDVEFLLDNGADVNKANKSGVTPLMKACIRGAEEKVKLLLDKGADVNAQDTVGDSALIVATKMVKNEIVEILLERGADMNLKNSRGESAVDIVSSWTKSEEKKEDEGEAKTDVKSDQKVGPIGFSSEDLKLQALKLKKVDKKDFADVKKEKSFIDLIKEGNFKLKKVKTDENEKRTVKSEVPPENETNLENILTRVISEQQKLLDNEDSNADSNADSSTDWVAPKTESETAEVSEKSSVEETVKVSSKTLVESSEEDSDDGGTFVVEKYHKVNFGEYSERVGDPKETFNEEEVQKVKNLLGDKFEVDNKLNCSITIGGIKHYVDLEGYELKFPPCINILNTKKINDLNLKTEKGKPIHYITKSQLEEIKTHVENKMGKNFEVDDSTGDIKYKGTREIVDKEGKVLSGANKGKKYCALKYELMDTLKNKLGEDRFELNDEKYVHKASGHLVDEEGRLIDENGNFVNEENATKYQTKADRENLQKNMGKDFDLMDDTIIKIVHKSGNEEVRVDRFGDKINENGNYLDRDGNIITDAKVTKDNDRIIRNDERVVHYETNKDKDILKKLNTPNAYLGSEKDQLQWQLILNGQSKPIYFEMDSHGRYIFKKVLNKSSLTEDNKGIISFNNPSITQQKKENVERAVEEIIVDLDGYELNENGNRLKKRYDYDLNETAEKSYEDEEDNNLVSDVEEDSDENQSNTDW